jgi:hypothetical protein
MQIITCTRGSLSSSSKANLFKKRKRMQEEARCRKRNLCPTEIHRYIDSRLA